MFITSLLAGFGTKVLIGYGLGKAGGTVLAGKVLTTTAIAAKAGSALSTAGKATSVLKTASTVAKAGEGGKAAKAVKVASAIARKGGEVPINKSAIVAKTLRTIVMEEEDNKQKLRRIFDKLSKAVDVADSIRNLNREKYEDIEEPDEEDIEELNKALTEYLYEGFLELRNLIFERTDLDESEKVEMYTQLMNLVLTE